MADRDRGRPKHPDPLFNNASDGGCHTKRVESPRNPPVKEISRRNGGKGVDKEKCSNKRSLLVKTGVLAGMVESQHWVTHATHSDSTSVANSLV